MSARYTLAFLFSVSVVGRLPSQEPAAACNPDSVASYRSLTGRSIVRQVSPYANFNDTMFLQRNAVRIRTPAGPRIVATLSWGGPDRGIVFLLACDGRLLHAIVQGYALTLTARDVDGDSVLDAVLNHETGTGTGWKQEATSVYRLVADTLATVWSGVTFEGNYQGPNMGGEWELRATVSFPAIGQILVTQDSGTVQYDNQLKRFTFIGTPSRVVRHYEWTSALATFRETL
jgi:hypothetical protein